MRCVSYTRYTSCIKNKEIPSNTILLQNQNIERYARSRKWVIRRKYADRKRDPQSEEAFLEMQKDGMARQFDMLVCDSLDHLGINMSVAAHLLKDVFYPAGIHFAIVEDDICSLNLSAEDVDKKLHYAIRKKTSGIAWDKIMENRDAGKFTVHDEKYGYLLSEDMTELLIDEEAADVIREIFELGAQGMICIRIAEKMNDQGYECPAVHLERVSRKHPKAFASTWSARMVSNILNSTHYYGIAYKKVHGIITEFHLPPIIEKEQFDQAYENRKEKAEKRKLAGPHKENIFRNLIFDYESGRTIYCQTFPNFDPQRRFYFERKTISCSILYEDVKKQVLDTIRNEIDLANTINKKLESEEAADHFDAAVEDIRRRMFELISSTDRATQKRIELSRIPDSETKCSEMNYNDRYLHELNDKFQKEMDQYKKIEKAFRDNPWVNLYGSIDIPIYPDNAWVRKCINAVFIKDMKDVTVEMKYTEWKQYLPPEWTNNYGTKNKKTGTDCSGDNSTSEA